MQPKVIEFRDLAEFVSIVSDFKNHKWLFRGQPKLRDENGELMLPLAKAGRKEYFLPNNGDLNRFERWSHQAIAFCSDIPINEFERLAYARHHGLATRLLDWTLNAAVALYFATEINPSFNEADKKDPDKNKKVEEDLFGVFIYRKPVREVDPERDKLRRCKSVMYYVARPVVRRILAQDGVFTVHPHPERPVGAQLLQDDKKPKGIDRDLVMLIPKSNSEKQRRILQEDLRNIGILGRSVYPDVIGLSDSINLVTHWMAHPRDGHPPPKSDLD